ncbi:MAG: translation initiation factor IF-2 [Bdellovibrionales bacterium]|nr:translation initiation factor IF-2 [Bdellovibrionales bacterium]
MDQPKVYEFAKEIGIETLALMDKIRKWDLPVKSHMAELSPELITEIKTKLDEETGSGKKAKTKKKVAKKKTSAKKKATKKVATANDGVATKKTTKKKATKKKTVIRRKKDEELAAAEVETPMEEVAVAAVEAETPTAKTVTRRKADAPVSEETPAEASPAATPEATTDDSDDKSTPARKREVMMTEGGPVSGVKSERPRRNIVGRMDLSKVDDKSQQQQRPQKTSNRNLRTGFVSAGASPFEMPSADDSDKFSRGGKDKDRRGKKTLAAPAAAPNSRDKEQAPPTFVSSDFKKREIVFQPKKKKIATNVAEFKKTEITMPAAHKRVVKVYGTMNVADLADELGIKAPALIKHLMKSGVMANVNTELDFDTISLIVPEFNYDAQNVQKSDEELIEQAAFGDLDAEKIPRTPVVTVMGHVDHGKTTLLDTIRKARVAAGEAGGITQHVGAYRVKTSIGECTFIDTPGHEAFTAMRARGANSTDIVILVVAADDGVMPQTIEAVSHAKAAGVPIIVAVNKMDRPDANPDRIKQQLSELELVPEDWGGNTIFVPVSALKAEGIDELLEQVSLLAEMQELKGNPNRSATGIVVESRVEKGKGNVATLLVQDGTLKAGQNVVIGEVACRVRQLFDETGKVIKEAGPSHPVEVIGLPESPLAGDKFDACKDERAAEKIAGQRREARLKEEAAGSGPMTLDDLFSKVKAGEVKELPVVLKTDVAGTGEAIKGMFDKISTDEVKIKVIHSAVGGISESDVLLASTAKGVIVGFNTRPDTVASQRAREKGVEIKTYSIVYELTDDMKKAMAGMLDPDVVEKSLGRVEVRDTFSVPKIGTIAGCFVTDGKVTRNALLRLIRDGKVVYSGKISSLKRFKDDVKEVQTGFECGIGIENYNDIKVGDEIEAYVQEEVAREL